MVALTPAQRDALSEMINVAFGRSAASLSILVNQRVVLEAPELELVSIKELPYVLPIRPNTEITTIHQVFQGELIGDILLLMDTNSASVLVDLMNGKDGQFHPLEEEDQDLLTEAGNILLGAFIGSFGNLLDIHLSFTVPNLYLEHLATMMNTVILDSKPIDYALVVKVRFHLPKGQVDGYIAIVMGLQSLEDLFRLLRYKGYTTV